MDTARIVWFLSTMVKLDYRNVVYFLLQQRNINLFLLGNQTVGCQSC